MPFAGRDAAAVRKTHVEPEPGPSPSATRPWALYPGRHQGPGPRRFWCALLTADSHRGRAHLTAPAWVVSLPGITGLAGIGAGAARASEASWELDADLECAHGRAWGPHLRAPI